MSTLALAFRLHRLRRFVQVLRGEGIKQAIGRAIVHIRLLRAGHIPGVVDEVVPATSEPSRFAFAPVWRDLAEKRAFHISRPPALLSRTRTVAMIGDLNLPQCRKYRVEQMNEIWRAAGIEYRFAHFEDVPRCQELLQECTHLMLYRLCQSDLVTMYLYEARRLRVPVLYDIDDPLFSISAYQAYGNMVAVDPALKAHFLDMAPRYLDVMNMADAVSLSTPGLVAHAGSYTARPIFLRRNFADRETLEAGAAAIANRRKAEGFTVAVASGSAGHDADLAVIREALIGFLRNGADRHLMVLGHLDPAFVPAPLRRQVQHLPFRDYPGYLRALAEADCALLPLMDDLFNACKSGVRVIDAAAVAVPSLASDVGDLPAMIENDVTGRTLGPDDWAGALEAMAGDRDAARKMGLAARQRLEATWRARTSLPVIDPALINWVRG